MLRFFKAADGACTPRRGSQGAAGFDLCSCEEKTVTILAHNRALIDTGLKIELPDGTYGRIAGRSGLAAKHCVDVGAGVIDGDYRGVLKVVLVNHSNKDFRVNKGDRIAQLILERYMDAQAVEVHEATELTQTQRQGDGFGSSGYTTTTTGQKN